MLEAYSPFEKGFFFFLSGLRLPSPIFLFFFFYFVFFFEDVNERQTLLIFLPR